MALSIRFGSFSLDSEGYVLAKGTEPVSLEPQVFSLLYYLLQNRDRVVSKDDLIEHVWDGRIVSDAAITSAINLVRRAVEDDGKTQATIKTFPKKGFRFVADIDNDATADTTHPALAPHSDRPSIAVLPFDNMSGDPEQEYFSDGMAEDLITDLSNIPDLYVVARHSSFSFKGQMPYVHEVSEKLGVKFVLEGSVRKMGDRLRVNAQLINAADGDHLWAKRYDGDMDEIFEFQDRIRTEIVSALELKLTSTDQAETERKPTDSVEAYDLFLRGRASYYHFTPQQLLEARKCLEKAIEIDPKFADAYGYLSYCHYYGWATKWPGFDDNLDRAITFAERGVALDGASAIALTRLGWTQLFLRRYDQAIENLEKAFDLAPNNADVIATFGQVLNFWGNPERALQMMEKAFSIEMVVPPNWEFQIGLSHLLLAQYEEAVGRFNRALEGPSKFPHTHLFMAGTYVKLDKLDDAKSAIKALLEIMPQYTLKTAARLYVFRNDDVRDRLIETLRKAGLPEG